MALIKETQHYVRGGMQKDVYIADDVIDVLCPLCDSDHKKRLYTEHSVIGVSQCLDCSLIFTSPRLIAPAEIYWGDLDKYYEEARLIFQGKAEHHRDPNYAEELELIQKWKPNKGRFLDVGCNMGFLLRHASACGWAAVGCEPSQSLSRLGSEHFGHQIFNCFLHEMPEDQVHRFDVVALSDVLEHISEPRLFLDAASRMLAADGLLYIKVPNARWNLWKQKTLQRLGRTPSQGVWDSYEHVVHYTDKSLKQMVTQAGFKILYCGIGKPVQVPVWHEYVGHYYQYPSPWWMDWRRQSGRAVCYWLSLVERLLRSGYVGSFAPSIVILAKRNLTA